MAAIVELSLLIGIGSSLGDVLNGLSSSMPLLVGTSVLLIVEKFAAALHARVFISEFVPNQKDVDFLRLNRRKNKPLQTTHPYRKRFRSQTACLSIP